MNAYRPTQSSNYLVIALKFLVLILGLYLSAIILGKIFSWILTVAFVLIRVIVFVGVAFIVLHFFLKILFKIDLFQIITNRRFRQR